MVAGHEDTDRPDCILRCSRRRWAGKRIHVPHDIRRAFPPPCSPRPASTSSSCALDVSTLVESREDGRFEERLPSPFPWEHTTTFRASYAVARERAHINVAVNIISLPYNRYQDAIEAFCHQDVEHLIEFSVQEADMHAFQSRVLRALSGGSPLRLRQANPIHTHCIRIRAKSKLSIAQTSHCIF